ncbi:MAG TPA: response regulator transcription factor [Syntrophales bacterium]|jgi:LuxR family transcriptional regulator of csgAB operon|nr:response regulator transcription factor [Syntrophales bacterium]HRT26551.1 response regulator transcription factor [Syntrophales bacterium]
MGTPANKQMIYIIGPRKLQNDILADYLEKELSAKCVVTADARHGPPVGENGQGCPALVLLDSPEKDLDKYFMGLESASKRSLSEHIVALFNVKPGSGIEDKAISWGIRGFFYEQDSPKQFVKGITAMVKGEMWYPRDVMAKYILSRKDTNNSKKDVIVLTQRELEILTMVISGSKNEDIANHLCISAHTVKTHIYNIFKKINVPNRLQAALWAAKNL